MKKIKRFLFWVFLITFAVTFFTQNSYRSVNVISSQTLREPVQTEIENAEKINFTKDGYEYELTPLFDYEINGLVVSKTDYTWFSIYKRDSVFPMDLCIIWGDNIKNKVYQNKSLSFSQDIRFCFWSWSGGSVGFNSNQVSNNHLVTDREVIEEKLKNISEGDQVKIKGKLVNIVAESIGEPEKYNPESFKWESSTIREDGGGGACETIYIEDVQILKKGNPIAYNLHKISFWCLLLMVAWGIVKLFTDTFLVGRKIS